DADAAAEMVDVDVAANEMVAADPTAAEMVAGLTDLVSP
ncbi:hypothetical protein A2U01_0102863, partial [Trifolium medium]|nr:hypothetical protein [Trifolium medium]